MRTNINHIRIFLASPGDVAEERAIVREVIEDINRTTAREKGLHLDVIGWDTDAYPTYGGDGQSLLNQQIAQMEEYDLFVGILWNRFGMPTPRAESGTEEEFNRADESFRTRRSPDIMFYFCQRPYNYRNAGELEQKAKVLQFKSRVQQNGLTWDYVENHDFRSMFHGHLLRWLTAHSVTVPNPPAPSDVDTPNNTLPASVPSPRTAGNTSPVSVMNDQPVSEVVNDSGMWMLLGTEFMEAVAVDEKADGTVVVQIAPTSSEEDAALRTLQGGRQRRSGQIPFAYQDTGGIAEVIDAEKKSLSGKSVWSVTLRLAEQSANVMTEVAYNNMSADEIAEMRARLILLNESPNPRRKRGQRGLDDSLLESFVMSGRGYSHRASISNLNSLWNRFRGQTEHFLPLARLWAVYHLITTNTVEHILELRLGPLQGNRLPIRFRGRRHKIYSNAPAPTIEVIGECDLSATPVIEEEADQ